MHDIKFPEITPNHRRLRPWMKASVKAITARIHEMKGKRKRPADVAKDAPWTGHVPGLPSLRWEARILTVAYGLVRGRTYAQIEAKTKSESPELRHLADQVEELLNTQAKLYVAINPYLGMTPEQKMVQGAHVAAQFVFEHPDTPWTNGTMMVVDAPSLFGRQSDDHLATIVGQANADPTGQWSWFCEPDFGGRVTAVAIWSPAGEDELRLAHAPRLQIQPIANLILNPGIRQQLAITHR